MKKSATLLLLALSATAYSAAVGFDFPIDVSHAPEDLPFARRAKATCEEWYPKINSILFGPSHALPYAKVPIIFDHNGNVIAYARKVVFGDGSATDEIHIARDQRNRPDSYEGMVIHELTHVVQNYPELPKEQVWLGEGIADYIRHKYYEKDIAGKLTVGEDGVLRGYNAKTPIFFGLQQNKTDLRKNGYRIGYTVAGEFLYWLEQSKDAEIIHKLNAALSDGTFAPDVFTRSCGFPLDELWRQFILYSET